MADFTFAFITPSYAPDFQRCKLLCWSIKKFISVPVKHYIVVDQKDRALFQELADQNTIILTKEDILPNWIKRIPFFDKKNFWLNLKGYRTGSFLVRGWLVQQIIKLAAAQYAAEEVLIFVDSDVAFIDTFEIDSLIRDDKVRLFRVAHQNDMDNKEGKNWKDTTKKLLGLPLENQYYDFYISQIVTWRRSNLLELYQLIEKNFNRDWLETISTVTNLSEYVLYGIFASYILGDKAGHYDDHLQKICWCYWENRPMSDTELQTFFQEARSSEHKAVMISAKSSMDLSIAEFQRYLA